MTIAEVARITGLSIHTIRFYESAGLLPPVARSSTGVRHFTESDVQYLRFLVSLKSVGLSLADIGEFTAGGCILPQLQQGEVDREVVERRVTLLRQHQVRLQEQQETVQQLLRHVEKQLRLYEPFLT